MDRSNKQTSVHTNKSGTSIPVYRNLQWSWFTKSYNYPKSNGSYKRNRHYKYFLTIIALLFASPTYAETVGGVSATASPVANSSNQ